MIKRLMLYRKTYKNYLDVAMHVKSKKYPIKAILRNGEYLIVNHPNEVYAHLMGLTYDLENDTVFISAKDSESQVKLRGAINNGEVVSIFLRKQYSFLPVKGRVVVDIGANIGDSAIYFALHDAERVIALEPYPRNYEMAKTNVELNNLSNKIQLVLAGCSSKNRYITVDPEKESDIRSQLDEFEKGIMIPLLTLDNILKRYNIDSAVLKMDCEGCEYEAILSSSDETLRKFSYMQIEYHYGYKNLKEKLEKSGFTVSITDPTYTVNNELKNPKMYAGWLYAKL